MSVYRALENISKARYADKWNQPPDLWLKIPVDKPTPKEHLTVRDGNYLKA
jgi:hypothetical protein